MALTKEEIENISKNGAEIISNLDITAFLEKIKKKAKNWKKDLTNGN